MPNYNAHQIMVAKQTIKAGLDLGVSPRGIIGGLAGGFVESNMQVLNNPKDPPSMNPKYGAVGSGYDSLSSGHLQQQPGKTWDAQPSWWGTIDCRMDPYCASKQFFERLLKIRIAGADYNHLGISIGRFVQAVQQSSFPDRYDQKVQEATDLYNRLISQVDSTRPGLPDISTIARPDFREIMMITGGGASARSRPPINFLFHTEEGNSSAEALARYCDGRNNVSYHYTVRDRIVCDVVDTDLYSWSVLAANAFTINLCFAGSKAGWSREQWMLRIADIEIACYLAVQDAKKYNFSTRVIVPPYATTGPGIADHKYVTQALKIGNHTDCGPNFPWDKVIEFINKYSGEVEDDMFTDNDRFLLKVLAEQRFASRSPLRHLGEGFVETVAGFGINSDAHGHVERTVTEAKAGAPKALALLEEVAGADLKKYPDRAEDKELAQLLLEDVKAYRRVIHGDGELVASS